MTLATVAPLTQAGHAHPSQAVPLKPGDNGRCSVHGNVQCGRWSQGSTSGSDAWFNYADTAGAGPSMPGACPP